MNTNPIQMSLRCPQARSLGHAVLPYYQFEFKGYATVSPNMHDEVEGVLWEITDDCEQALDRLEGYPTFYSKIIVWVKHNNELKPCMMYLMHPDEDYEYPSNSYVDSVVDGYEAHGVDTHQIDLALMYLDHHFVLTDD